MLFWFWLQQVSLTVRIFFCNNLFQSSNLIGRAFQTMTFCITPFVCAFQIVRLWWGISACYIFMPIDSDKWLHNSWSHFQTNKLSAWPTSTYCKICIRKFFTLTWNSQSHGFLLKLFDFACKKNWTFLTHYMNLSE